MTDAESAVRFHPFQTPLSFTPNVVFVSHFIIGRPFHNDDHVSAAVALGPWANSYSRLLISSTAIPNHCVKEILILELP